MADAMTGGCACGAIRYVIAGEPVFSNHCQCRDCQRESGTGHASFATFRRGDVKTSGDAKTWDMRGDSGAVKTRHFCSDCGTAVCLTFAAMPDFIAIRAATLDEPERFRPQAVTYAVRGYGWDHLDPALVKFDRMPPAG